jgi:UDP-N-acetylmuramoylalanine--D-glutamate ligase
MQAEESPLGLRRRPRPRVPEGPYVVAGLGEAGRAAVKALCRVEGSERVLASDHRPAGVPKRVRSALKAAGVRTHLGGQDELLNLSPPPRTLIKSPGVPTDAPLLQQARQRGIEVLDELELGWRLGGAPMIAVTGTNGKTTTAALTAAVLARSGIKAVLAGNADIAPPLSAVTDEPDLIVCEVSSFQLEGCPALMPEVAVFTNLSHDHLSRHGTMRRYGEVKRSLFIKDDVAVGLAVVDTIDEFGRELADDVERAGGRAIRVGLGPEATYRIQDARWDLRNAELELDTPSGQITLETRLPGDYNARNVAAVVALADSLDVEHSVLAEVLATHPGAQGRFEHIDCGQRPELILDTASSPVAVEQFLSAVRAGMDPSARLHAVLGVLGAPDPDQRRAIGRAARRLCDRLVLTAGSFRPKPPLRTLEGMIAGARRVRGADLAVVPNREEAIATALRGAMRGDVVSILGRGNVVESIHSGKVDDRGALYRVLRAHQRGRLGPEGSGEASSRELGVKFEQRRIGR